MYGAKIVSYSSVLLKIVCWSSGWVLYPEQCNIQCKSHNNKG